MFYGLANATEVAYYTYMYAKVSKEHYQQVTSHARAGALIGRFLAAVLSQIMISSSLMDYRQLNYLSLAGIRSIVTLVPRVWLLRFHIPYLTFPSNRAPSIHRRH